jgi:hypothetical protein
MGGSASQILKNNRPGRDHHVVAQKPAAQRLTTTSCMQRMDRRKRWWIKKIPAQDHKWGQYA